MAIWRRVEPTPADDWGPLPPHAGRPPRRALRLLERLLFVVGTLSLGYYAVVWLETAVYQAYENRELNALLLREVDGGAAEADAVGTAGAPGKNETGVTAATAPPPRRAPRAVTTGTTIGRVEIPRLGVSAIVRAGADARTLSLAVGHIPGTAMPGDDGNIGLAGHRDTFFRQLRYIRPDDEIRIVTKDGTYSYRVQRTDVVNPKDVWVLDPTDTPTVTLVTCFPFTFIGKAPQRFIVRATAAPRPIV